MNMVICDRCNGSGSINTWTTLWATCPRCQGSGRLIRIGMPLEDQLTLTWQEE